jgi:hypothetical protein
VRERLAVVGDVDAVTPLIGTHKFDERRGDGVVRRVEPAVIGVVQAIDLPAVDDELNQVAQAAEAVSLLSGDGGSSGVVARAAILHLPGRRDQAATPAPWAPRSAAWPAAMRATCTRNGEHDT